MSLKSIRVGNKRRQHLDQEGDISDLLERLRARGWRITPQRRVVAEVLRGEHVHRSAEEVHDRARRRLPELSLATVYNTLNELVAMGELQEVLRIRWGEALRPDVTVPHQHLACVECGELRDVHPRGVEGLRLPPPERHGFEILTVDVVFRGRCPNCSGI